MQSFNFDDGLKSFAINGDESRVIRFNPADPDLIPRYYKALELIRSAADGLGEVIPEKQGEAEVDLERSVRAIEEMNGVIREALKLMFNTDVYDTVFSGQSPFSMIRGGKYLIEAFMESLLPVLETEIREYKNASEKRMEKYLRGYQK